MFARFAAAGVAVYSGDIVGHGRSEGRRALVESYKSAVRGAAARASRSSTLACVAQAPAAGRRSSRCLLRRPFCLRPRPPQVDEFLSLCGHARQDVAARFPGAAPAWFIGGCVC